jgi:hypothetical protein
MFRFENPFDPSKDGQNAIIDGIRYHIRNSNEVKEQVLVVLKGLKVHGAATPMQILEHALYELDYSLDDLTISDEHELLYIIKCKMNNDEF